MTRTWFRCYVCHRECDNSARHHSPDPRLNDSITGICKLCASSFCSQCRTLYIVDSVGNSHAATCPTCGGGGGFIGSDLARNINELNTKDKP